MNHGFWLNFRHACRRLRKVPGFCLGVILLLGISIGGTTAISTASYQLFFKKLPYAQPEQLVEFSSIAHAMGGFNLGISPAMMEELQQTGSFGELAAFEEIDALQDTDGETWQHAALSDNLTGMLSVAPLLGRSFNRDDTLTNAPVAMLSESSWRNRFGSSTDILGKKIQLQERLVTVIGVMPGYFVLPSPGVELWTPLVFAPEQLSAENINQFIGLDVIGRLPPDSNAEIAMQQLQAFYAEDARLAPMVEITGLELSVKPLQEAWAANHQQVLTILTIAIFLVLLAAALNLAGLWMGRTLGRSHELAVQTALGGSRWIALQFFSIEYLLLGIAGLALSLLVSPMILGWLSALNVLDNELPIQVSIGFTGVFFAVAFLFLSALPVLLAVWWQSSQVQRYSASRLVTGGKATNTAGNRSRNTLIVAQLAMAMSLLVTVTLLLQSWRALLNEDLGFDSQRLVMAQIGGGQDGLDISDINDQSADTRAGLKMLAAINQLHSIPGVDQASFTSIAPFSSSETLSTYSLPDAPDVEYGGRTRQVGINFFDTLNVPILAGQPFGQQHLSEGSNAVIVDQEFVRRHFADENVIGRLIQYDTPEQPGGIYEIVGVSTTVKHARPDEEPEQPTIYFPAQLPYRSAHALVATSLPPASLVDQVRTVLQTQLGEENVGQVSSLQNLVRRTLREREPQLILLTVFGCITVLLAAVGIYALLGYAVKQRTAEFGVRLAVGADRWRIRQLVLNSGLRLLGPGIILGIIGALAGGTLIRDQLYSVDIMHPGSWAAVAGFLVLIVLLAGLWPSEQAARTAPTEALRYE